MVSTSSWHLADINWSLLSIMIPAAMMARIFHLWWILGYLCALKSHHSIKDVEDLLGIQVTNEYELHHWEHHTESITAYLLICNNKIPPWGDASICSKFEPSNLQTIWRLIGYCWSSMIGNVGSKSTYKRIVWKAHISYDSTSSIIGITFNAR